MLKALNNTASRLWKDESGVVLAFTIIVFLTLFVMACSVYAVGETVRLRVEVQNAADAAAYSGAIVQADCNSRVAALNRAMSWCYVQMVRMEMDYIVDKWLYLTLKSWKDDNDWMKKINDLGDCNKGQPYYGTGYGVSVYNTENHEKIMLNKHQLVSKSEIENARTDADNAGKSYTKLAHPIDLCRDNINALNDKERELIDKLPGRIKKTVEQILKDNIAETWNDSFAGGGGISYALFQQESPRDKNFNVLKAKDEDDFLRHSDYIPTQGNTAPDVFGTGSKVGQWFVLTGDGILRDYVQRINMLIADWSYCTSTSYYDEEGNCIMVFMLPPIPDNVKGEDGYDSYYKTALAEPQVLKDTYFAAGGSIVVGVARKVNNPFQFMAIGGELGVIRPFTLDNGNRFMWTATAAIAGYNPKPPQDCKGKYEVTYEDNGGNKLWNLKTSDWDAELIPLHRAGAKGAGHAWTGETAGEILTKVKGGPWVALYGGGGAPGAQGGPKGMNEGAEINYGGAEGWVVH